jgi:hypothetical protein
MATAVERATTQALLSPAADDSAKRYRKRSVSQTLSVEGIGECNWIEISTAMIHRPTGGPETTSHPQSSRCPQTRTNKYRGKEENEN